MNACYESRVSARICWAAPCAHERQAVHQRTPKEHEIWEASPIYVFSTDGYIMITGGLEQGMISYGDAFDDPMRTKGDCNSLYMEEPLMKHLELIRK